MALISMTGYGRGEVVAKGLKIEVELSSVNRKQFDVRISMPNNLSGLDAKIKKLVHDSISRGSVFPSTDGETIRLQKRIPSRIDAMIPIFLDRRASGENSPRTGSFASLNKVSLLNHTESPL